MDDLLREFVTETNESLDVVDVELVRFEQDPNNAQILDNIFRLVHTIKGTCGFLGLPRLEALAHAAETLMGKFRDGAPASSEAVTLILSTIDRIKGILNSLEREQREPEGGDTDLISSLERMVERVGSAGDQAEAGHTVGTLVSQILERPLQPDENSLDDLERAFRDTEIDPQLVKSRSAPALDAGAKDDDGKGASQSIRVTVDTLEHLMTMVSELVLTRNQLLEIVRRHEESEFKTPLQRLSNVTAELQEGVMKTRMQPIGNAWQKLPRIVRDLSNELGKKIELEMHGAETELDRQVLDLIKDPLTHMVRNSADHGLETSEQRRAAGKPEHGLIRLSAYHEGGYIIIRIADDGRGLNTERIKSKAIAQGLVSEAEAEKLTEAQINKFIFAPGFSTAAKVTNVSGRGVGMDVVRNNIDQIGGTIDVKSVAGAGTEFHHQDSAHAGDRRSLDRGSKRSPVCDPATVGRRARARARGQRAPHRKHQGHARSCGCATSFCLWLASASCLASRRCPGLQERFYCRNAGRQPDVRHCRGRRVSHRRNRGEADVEQAASYRDVLRQHDSRRRLGHHDHRSERRRAAFGNAVASQMARRSSGQAPAAGSRRSDDLAAGVPRRLEPAQGGAAVAHHAPRGNRRAQDRAVERPPHGAVPRPADAAGQHERRACA